MVYLALLFLLCHGLYIYLLLTVLFHFFTAGKPLIISHNGASGDYPGCTDLAYQKAVDDGADVIDCPVQVTKDGIPICLSSIDLMTDTTIARSQFISQTATIKDIQIAPGVFSFNLTWDDIVKNLKRKLN
jgi:glycerophosphoryl diester phosphodiesterase